jgi:glycosyltransferase involved in cell wall biosynthesis
VYASVIICTCNREASLKGALQAVEQCTVPAGSCIELLVVDNASTDSTPEVVRSFASRKYTVNYLYEPERGKGNAYNAGITAARGEICIFTDDDVRPTERWLVEHIDAYTNPEVAAVQGRIELEFDSPPPEWMEEIHRSFLAETVPGDDPIFPYTNNLVGANMSFRKSAALDTGPFNPLLGPGRSGFWDESEFSIRMKRKGYRLLYNPGASVRHLIPTARLTADYFKDAAFRQGVSCYIAEALGAFTVNRRPFYELIYSNLRHVKMLVKAKLRGERYLCTQDDLFFRMHMGVTWAYYQGLKRLTRRYSI